MENGVSAEERIQPLPVMPHTSYAMASAENAGQSKDEPALRYDQGKNEFHHFDTYFDPGFAAEIGRAFDYGARKYGRNNWQKGMSWSRCLNSGRRHLFAWWRGEVYDKESGIHHLALLTCSIMFLFVYERDKLGKDDR